MPRKPQGSIDEEVLKGLQQAGITSPVLEARLAYAEAKQLLSHYLHPMATASRVYPNQCSPQASGRLSVSSPPLINFTADKKYGPHGIRDVVVPDPGTEWACYDWSAIEARLVMVACNDKIDEETFRRDWDIHTVTGIRMLRWPEPPFEPTKALLFGAEGREWCAKVGSLRLGGLPYSENDPYRTLFKNCRYTLQYAKDHRAMSIYAVKMAMPVLDLYHFGKLYLASKPWLTNWKRRTWAECWRTHEARTAFGRRRRLAGNRANVEKEGLNHMIQGTVADMLRMTIARVCSFIECLGLAYQTHDGAKFIFTVGASPMNQLSEVVEREWEMWGRSLQVPATWEIIRG